MEPTCARYPTLHSMVSIQLRALPSACPNCSRCEHMPQALAQSRTSQPIFQYTFCTSLFPARLLNSLPPNVYLPKLA
ncbi:uncharacterized protein PgNI_04274 [Pyricularia grisea]|uniref:Uncharacterized protein n=1 Tax=Pyricularia grisea TaxID=148305 RepID=A0A6P8BBJ8_PYRGI|nr:uncharacterized protein PgNI_04274 [Pyricularia grisea]TLD13200.1 hypothetical protein PgNI_04274 [Pyricularia grisea]